MYHLQNIVKNNATTVNARNTNIVENIKKYASIQAQIYTLHLCKIKLNILLNTCCSIKF